MVDYHPSYAFLEAISSDVAANYNTSDTTIVTITGDANQLTVVKASDYNYHMNSHALMSFNGLCASGENPNHLSGYIQRRMMEWSGAVKVGYCHSSDTAIVQFLWNAPGAL